MLNIRLNLLLLSLLLLLLSSCQSEQHEKIDSKSPLIIVVNIIDKSLSFYDEQSRNEITKWEMPFTYTGALLLPDNKTLLLYGKHLDKVYLYDLTKGRQVGKWKLGKGIANAILSNDQATIYFANQEKDAVIAMTLAGNQTSEIAVGNNPQTMTESDQLDLLYVLNFDDPMITVIDTKANKKIRTFIGKRAAAGAVLIGALDELWTGGHGTGEQGENAVTIYSLKTGEIKQEIKAPIMPIDLEKLHEDVFVLSHGTNQLRKIDSHTKEIKAVIEIGANPVDMSIFNDLIYVTSFDSDELIIIDPNEMTIKETLKTGKGPFKVIFRGSFRASSKNSGHKYAKAHLIRGGQDEQT